MSKIEEAIDAALLERLQQTVETLEAIANDRRLLAAITPDERKRLLIAVGKVFNPDQAERRRLVKAVTRLRKVERVNRDEKSRAETGIRELRRKPVFTTPNFFPPPATEQGNPLGEVEADARPHLADQRHCYACKNDFTQVHHFYDQLCPSCAELNFWKRTELTDLTGRVALLTGGRVKIGYQAGLKLLRCGAHLIVTTRFARDCAMRYAAEPDFEQWGHRLEVFGLDLRHTPSVEAFCQQMLETRHRLDFIVNNACQTVRRPPEFYAHMMERETAVVDTMPEHVRKLVGPSGPVGLTHAAELSQVALLPEELTSQKHLFPEGQLDKDLQQVDLRGRNSWRLLMAEVPVVELLEVQLVNAVAPFVLNARLKPLMMRTANRDKHIVNVSAVEGQFYRSFKTTRHPHTNMAKAALNMMTRTAAADYESDGIHMNSVDTGWVTDEDPLEIANRKTEEHRFHPPLDIVDGAARIVDPIISGLNAGVHVWGQFLKDYKATSW